MIAVLLLRKNASWTVRLFIANEANEREAFQNSSELRDK